MWDPKIILIKIIAHEYQLVLKSHTSKVSSGFSISLRRKRWSNWPGVNFISIRSYKSRNRLQVWECGFQELRLAITNKELIKTKRNPWSSGIKIWKFRNVSFHLVHTRRQSSGIIFLEFRKRSKFTTYSRGMSYNIQSLYLDFTSRKLEKISFKEVLSHIWYLTSYWHP